MTTPTARARKSKPGKPAARSRASARSIVEAQAVPAAELEAIEAEIDTDRRRRTAVRRVEPLARAGDGRSFRFR